MLDSSQIFLDTRKNINLHCLALHFLHIWCIKHGSVLNCLRNHRVFISLLRNSLWLFGYSVPYQEGLSIKSLEVWSGTLAYKYCVSGPTVKPCNELSSVARGWVTAKVAEQVVSTTCKISDKSALLVSHVLLAWGIAPNSEQLWTLYTQLQLTLTGDSQRSLDGGISRDISDRCLLSLRGRQKVYCSKCLLFCKRHQGSKPLQSPIHCGNILLCMIQKEKICFWNPIIIATWILSILSLLYYVIFIFLKSDF